LRVTNGDAPMSCQAALPAPNVFALARHPDAIPGLARRLIGSAFWRSCSAHPSGRRSRSPTSSVAETVQLLLGYTVGGNSDLPARILARHIGRRIPGNPTVVPHNMAAPPSLPLAP